MKNDTNGAEIAPCSTVEIRKAGFAASILLKNHLVRFYEMFMEIGRVTGSETQFSKFVFDNSIHY
jgi:hypothetical protein